jgi:hypothetical protein
VEAASRRLVQPAVAASASLAAVQHFASANDRIGSMLSKKGFCDEWRATSIQDQMQMRNLD